MSHHFLLHFPIGMGSYDAKYQGVFPENTFSIRVPPLNSFKFSLSKGPPLKCFLGGPKTHPDIFCGCHRNQYQYENAIRLLDSKKINVKPLITKTFKFK